MTHIGIRHSILFLLLLLSLRCMGQNSSNLFDAFQSSTDAAFDSFVQAEEEEFTCYLDSVRSKYAQFRDSCMTRLEEMRRGDNVAFGNLLEETWSDVGEMTTESPTAFESGAPTANGEPLSASTSTTHSGFYGIELTLGEMESLPIHIATPTEHQIALAWNKLNNLALHELIADYMTLAKSMQLNAWGEYQLARWYAGELFPSGQTNEQTLFCFFLLRQLQYNCKLSCSAANKLIILMDTNAKVYNQPSKVLGDATFYILDKGVKSSSLKALASDISTPRRKFNLTLTQLPHLGKSERTVAHTWLWRGAKRRVQLPENKHLVDFLEQYPFVPLSVVACIPISEPLERLLDEAIQFSTPDKRENLNYLLRFVQQHCHYQEDLATWGAERYFSAEESFHYPYHDCEDYTILLNRLIKRYMDVNTLFVLYSNHIALAAAIPPKTGDYVISHQGKPYVLCDPTYLGASLGECQPAYQSAKFQLLEAR